MSRPYAVALCRKADKVLLSNGEVAPFTEWLDEDGEVTYQTGPEIPEDARWIGYVRKGRSFATDLSCVEIVSLH